SCPDVLVAALEKIRGVSVPIQRGSAEFSFAADGCQRLPLTELSLYFSSIWMRANRTISLVTAAFGSRRMHDLFSSHRHCFLTVTSVLFG
ncbi:MAG TPA: hypothetical protein VMV59_12165, partial [Candidatus Dormibacteraeota bacterium]|nr:hypothetical protein [Candidatus Dormibacteraeota bacterium]